MLYSKTGLVLSVAYFGSSGAQAKITFVSSPTHPVEGGEASVTDIHLITVIASRLVTSRFGSLRPLLYGGLPLWVQGLHRTGCASGPAARVDGPSGTYPTPYGDSTVVWGCMVVWHSADVHTVVCHASSHHFPIDHKHCLWCLLFVFSSKHCVLF